MTRLPTLLIVCASLLGCVPSADDSETANQVAQYLQATRVVPTAAGSSSHAHSGKVVYVAPGANGSPQFVYYAVTDPAEIEKLKAAAEEALTKVPSANEVTLHFMEREVIRESPDGSSHRGKERKIASHVVRRR